MFLRQRPAAPLAAYVECLWYSSRDALPHTYECSLPTGCADIVLPLLQDHLVREDEHGLVARWLRGAVVQGPFDRFGVRGTTGPSTVLGVHFRADGAAAFFGGALPTLRNRTELLEDLWGLPARTLRERLQAATSPQNALLVMHEHLVQRLMGAPPVDSLGRVALSAFRRDPVQGDSGRRGALRPRQRRTAPCIGRCRHAGNGTAAQKCAGRDSSRQDRAAPGEVQQAARAGGQAGGRWRLPTRAGADRFHAGFGGSGPRRRGPGA